MPGLVVRPFVETDRAAVVDLWARCNLTRPWNDPGLDINRKLTADPDGFLVGEAEGVVVATVMAGYDGHRGWINYLAVSPDAQSAGHGSAMMQAAEARLSALGCPKINLQIRTSNVDGMRFYEAIGYTPDAVISMGRRLIEDERRSIIDRTATRPPDAGFADARLVECYDVFEGERDDLDHYEAIVAELGATTVLDIGCGTGVLAIRLAERGLDVTGVDPAAASLDVAQAKEGADLVQWVLADATRLDRVLPEHAMDVATMAGNVAQIFVTDEEWSAVLSGLAAIIRPGGHLVFETRVPERRAWNAWTEELTRSQVEVPGRGTVETWCQITAVADDLVSFRWTYVFEQEDLTLHSDSTLRFRARDLIESTLEAAGFDVVDVRDAPDRPGHEHVFIARRR